MSRIIYEFRCVKCNKAHDFFIEPEQIQDFEINQRCDECGGHLKRAIVFGGGVFKGKGFTKKRC